MKKKELEERVADIEGSIMCMECKDHLDSDDLSSTWLSQSRISQCKKGSGKWQLRTMRSFFLTATLTM